MSFEDNEHANGAGGRFNGLDEKYKAGGRPRVYDEEKSSTIYEAISEAMDFFSLRGRTHDEITLGSPLLADMTAVELAKEFKAIHCLKEAIDLLDKEVSRIYDHMRLVVIPARFEADGISNMKVEGVGRVQLTGDIYAGIVKGREDSAFEWLDDNGRGDLVKRTVNSSSLKAVLKQALQNGEELPDFFKAEPFTRASIVKA